jgi:hypothetical protein
MNVIQMVGASFGAIIVIFGGIVSIYRVTKRIDSAIGLDKDGRTVSERIARVEHQIFPNGGSSLADKVNDLDLQIKEISGEVKILSSMLQILVKRD